MTFTVAAQRPEPHPVRHREPRGRPAGQDERDIDGARPNRIVGRVAAGVAVEGVCGGPAVEGVVADIAGKVGEIVEVRVTYHGTPTGGYFGFSSAG